MDSSEKRRKELLEQTRRMYSDRREPPAVHPRYGAAYHKLYGNDESEGAYPAGTFGVRLFLAFLLFACFVTMDRQEYKVLKVDSDRIVKEIQVDYDVKEIWPEDLFP